MSVLVKWFIIGFVVGIIGWLIVSRDPGSFLPATLTFGAIGVVVRKWVFRTFWQ